MPSGTVIKAESYKTNFAKKTLDVGHIVASWF